MLGRVTLIALPVGDHGINWWDAAGALIALFSIAVAVTAGAAEASG